LGKNFPHENSTKHNNVNETVLPEEKVMSDLLEDYPVIMEMSVSWGDMDALQHVNHAVYFQYFLNGRVTYLEALNVMELMDETGVGLILASIQCKFKIPLTYPDRILVGTKVDKIEEDRFYVKQALVSDKHGKIATVAESLIVTFDYKNNKKVDIPEEMKQRIEKLERQATRKEQ
jgi:acyl-CoA thioester hydrolase